MFFALYLESKSKVLTDMGSLTQALSYINEKPTKLQGIGGKLTHISVTEELKEARKKQLKTLRVKK